MCDCQNGYNAFSCSRPRAGCKMLSMFCLTASYSRSCFLSLPYSVYSAFPSAAFSAQSFPVPAPSPGRAAQCSALCLPFVHRPFHIRVWDYPKGLPQQALACEGTSRCAAIRQDGRVRFLGVWLHSLCLLRYLLSLTTTVNTPKTAK